jgi:hypothetical protein
MKVILLYAGAIMIFAWGIGHLIPTTSIVNGFGSLSEDNRRTITMEWIAEGLTLCFIGLLVIAALLTFGPASQTVTFVGRACALMLLVLAVLSTLTGARTSVLPMRLCPVIKTLAGASFIAGTL